MDKRVFFKNKTLPYLLIAPQIIITLMFFIWPAVQAVHQSFLRQDAFGFKTTFVWLENYKDLFQDPHYLQAFFNTFIFSFSVALLSLSFSLFLAVQVDRLIKAAKFYQTLMIWPYAVAPVIAGALWMFLFDPNIGYIAYQLKNMGINWNFHLNGDQAMLLVVIAAAWKQVSYNFLFFLAGLQSIPKAVIEAAAIDGAGPTKRFFTIIFPLLSPTTFFLLVMNIVYAFFETFGIIHSVTEGGPGGATQTLVYKAWHDGFVTQQYGVSTAQSVILMIIVMGLTVIQFRYVEKKVHY